MDRPVLPIAKQLARDIAPRPAFLPAEIERNRVRELNAIERELATKETNDTSACLDESDRPRRLSRSLSVRMIGATGCDPSSDDQKRGCRGPDSHPSGVRSDSQ